MSNTARGGEVAGRDVAPGDAESYDAASGIRTCLIGLVLAGGLTVASFWALHTRLIWGPGIGMALAALAIAQMGVHLVFFLKITTGRDNTNNVLALAFGVLIVTLLVGGSLWIMANLNRHHDMSHPSALAAWPTAVNPFGLRARIAS